MRTRLSTILVVIVMRSCDWVIYFVFGKKLGFSLPRSSSTGSNSSAEIEIVNLLISHRLRFVFVGE
jgi:hypothetical protein